MAMISKNDPNTNETFNFYEVPSAEGSANLDGVIYIFHTDGKYYKRAFTGAMNVKWFGATGDGITDDTAAIQLAINSVKNYKFADLDFDTGVYLISSRLNIVNGTVNLRGQGSAKKILPGGQQINNSTIFRWIEPGQQSEKTILYIENVMGITISGITFDTMTGEGDLDQNEMIIEHVTAIRYINRSSTRYNEISNCSFHLLDIGVHYSFDNYDFNPNDGIIDGDTNMDTNFIDRCSFHDCVIGIKVEQTNVYNALISRCAFYGSYTYTKHHLLIVKGHAEISDSYLGVLMNIVHDENGVVIDYGTAVEVNQGYCNLYNIYAETHNGPFFVWKSALHEGMLDGNENLLTENCVSNLISCNVMANTDPLPTDYIVENRTSKTLNVVGGEYTYWFSQKESTSENIPTGAISIFGTNNVNVSEHSAAGRVFFFGNKFNVPVAGSVPDAQYKGGGRLHVVGEVPEFYLSQVPAFKSLVFRWEGNILYMGSPGFFPDVYFDFANKILKMPGWTIDTTTP